MASRRQLALLLAMSWLATSAFASTFETATVNVDEYVITSIWEGTLPGLCASLTARNPGNNPTSSWTSQFSVSGAVVTSGPNGPGVARQEALQTWTFEPTDPAQQIVNGGQPIMVTFCANQLAGTDLTTALKARFTVIFTYDFRGMNTYPPPPPPSPPSPPPPSPSPPPPPPSPPSPPPPSPPPPSPPSPPPTPPPVPAPSPAPVVLPPVVAPAPGASPAPVPVPTPPVISSPGRVDSQDVDQPSLTVPAAPPPPPPSAAESSLQVCLPLLAALAAAMAMML